jgi:hypothetical protein
MNLMLNVFALQSYNIKMEEKRKNFFETRHQLHINNNIWSFNTANRRYAESCRFVMLGASRRKQQSFFSFFTVKKVYKQVI